MTQVMKGIRVLEVAQFTFVPAAGAVLADWGADVIKIEHPVKGDGQRGLIQVGGQDNSGNINFLMEHANRGKRSVGIDISNEEGRELLYEIARSSDVFLTNFLPGAREKLKIDVEHIRAVNPKASFCQSSKTRPCSLCWGRFMGAMGGPPSGFRIFAAACRSTTSRVCRTSGSVRRAGRQL